MRGLVEDSVRTGDGNFLIDTGNDNLATLSEYLRLNIFERWCVSRTSLPFS
ncbi:hypothetical protein SPIROBIBN47_250065 [uncultured spirochete]|jgi:hypothetical protein|uniref:Uncharacterized protein n=1 Tax=uncultured spirochete TaxID=156406 RepID=A0A3P3XI46_9SPIR|nr:hypothetical protein SPIROBIBN47_250065 [uncultured spirochete]